MTTPSALAIQRELSAYIKSVSKQTLIEQPVDPRRVFFLRPSSLPFCGLRRLFTYATTGIPTTRFMDSSGFYNVSMGTQAHELVQDVMARGGRVWGDWECVSCRYKRHWSKQAACPRCGSRMAYRELEVAWRAWRGHMDGVFEDLQSDKWIIDYKTTSDEKIAKNKIVVAKTYIAQQERYCVFVERKHKVKIKGWILIYSSRDNVYKKHRIIANTMTTAHKAEVLYKAMQESSLHKKLWKVADVEHMKPFVDSKLCQSRTEHDAYFPWEPCPLCDTCFNKTKLRSLPSRIAKESDNRLPLIQFMPDTVRHELYRSPLFV